MTIQFWSNDPTVLFNKDYIFELWPTTNMCYEQKLNAITRLIILITILGYILTMSLRILIVGALTLVVILILFTMRKKKITKEMINEGFKVEGNEVTGMFDKSKQIVNPVTLQSVLKSEFKEIVDFIDHHGKIYWNHMNLTSQEEPYTLQLWANDVPPGGFTAAHNHTPIAIGGVFYLDADPNKGNLHLEDPTHFCRERMPYDWQKKPYVFSEEITAEAGKIVMFPGYLMHHVRSNKSTSNRIAFGFNFGLSWQYKARPY